MKKKLVIGAARSGVAASKLLIDNKFPVILTDTREQEKIVSEFPQIETELKDLLNKNIGIIFGQQIDVSILDEVDEIIVSPGVPLTIPVIQAAYNKGIPVIGEVELAYRYTKTPIIAITGTNGKTTTTTLTGAIFKNSGRNTFVVGNIGDPVCYYANQGKAEDIFITEIGSFQLETIKDFRPISSAIINISPDHLDRHKTMENYVAAKARVFENQRDDDFCVVNADDPQVMAIAKNVKCDVKYISLNREVTDGAYLLDSSIYISDNNRKYYLCDMADIRLKGQHNIQNALVAITLSYFNGVSTKDIKNTLREFTGVEHRQEYVATINGVTYINDSKGTNTNATIVALEAMEKPVVLIAGGYDKNEDYKELIKIAKDKVKCLILLGTTASKIKSEALKQKLACVKEVADYKEAVDYAYKTAEEGDVVLLSPACASWDMFDNYEIRGNYFKSLILERKEN